MNIGTDRHPLCRPNYSSRFAPPELSKVTLQVYQNIYEYDRSTFWIAYGISLVISTIVVIAGMVVIAHNGASYSSSFSTFLRVGRTARLDVEVMDRDGSGHDPLPSYLKRARLDIGIKDTDNNAYELIETPVEEQRLESGPEYQSNRMITRKTV